MNSKKIPYQIEKRETFLGRLMGLMFRKGLPHNTGLLLIPCNSIHTLFMRFHIDVIFLNKEGKIVKMIEDVRPWSFIFPVSNAYSVLEFCTGTIKLFGMNEGDLFILS